MVRESDRGCVGSNCKRISVCRNAGATMRKQDAKGNNDDGRQCNEIWHVTLATWGHLGCWQKVGPDRGTPNDGEAPAATTTAMCLQARRPCTARLILAAIANARSGRKCGCGGGWVCVCVSDRGAVTSACLTHCRRLIRADRSIDGDGMGGKDAWLAALAATGVPPRKLAISERFSERVSERGPAGRLAVSRPAWWCCIGGRLDGRLVSFRFVGPCSGVPLPTPCGRRGRQAGKQRGNVSISVRSIVLILHIGPRQSRQHRIKQEMLARRGTIFQ